MTGGGLWPGASREETGAVCLIMDRRLYFKQRCKNIASHIRTLRITPNAFNWDPTYTSLLLREEKRHYCPFHLTKNCFFFFFWQVLTLAPFPLPCDPDALWFTVKITAEAGKVCLFPFLSFFFCICQVFNVNLPLLVTSAFPSSRLLLFSLKRLWSPIDQGDLRTAPLWLSA